MMNTLIYFLLLVHILMCIVVGILIHYKKINTDNLILPTVALVPVCGILILLIDRWIDRRHKTGTKMIDLDKLRVEDIKYKQISMAQEGDEQMVVPLEEAIAVNNSKICRTLMLDILQRDPSEYIDLLQRARLSDDTELTHYATTSMMEIQSGHEQMIRSLEHELSYAPRDRRIKVLRQLRLELSSYIDSGLISGTIMTIFRRKLGDVLNQLLELEPENKSCTMERISNDLSMDEVQRARENLDSALRRWPEDEQIYMLYTRYYYVTGQGQKLQEFLSGIEKKHIYLSSEGKKWFSFWREKEHAV